MFPTVLYFIFGIVMLGLLYLLIVVLYKRVKRLRRVWALLLLVFLTEFALCRFGSIGFPPLFYILLSVVWFFFIILLERAVIGKAPWQGGDMAWAKQVIGMPGWKWARLLLAVSPLLIGPLAAPGGGQLAADLLLKILP